MVFKSVVISKSENFLELYPDTALPEFYWLQVIGRAETDDFGVAEKNRLVVSHTALTILKNFNVNHADISIFSNSS
ncbi:Phosphotransferase system IIA component [Pseudomonas syringae pv. actinidiae]|uniref:Phosphotransferase system IIA component n=1 Tax=Pseudomonas syringae pv. actinidiae TaxID=103796 RepID=A0A2V0QT38_PSESF|nr:Phosphotransferase system IIA component [Pseudomonas syringae pv. actinidiae]